MLFKGILEHRWKIMLIMSPYRPHIGNASKVMNKWFVLPTTPKRAYKSPAELIFGIKPNVSSFEASGTIVVHKKPIKGKVVPGFGTPPPPSRL